MNKSEDNNKINALATFFKYLKGKMNASDQHAFERNLLNDAFESDAFDGLKHFNENEIEEELAFLKNKINPVKSNNIRFLHKKSLAIAASIIVILGLITTLWLLQPSQPVLVSESKEVHMDLSKDSVTTKKVIIDKLAVQPEAIPVKRNENSTEQAIDKRGIIIADRASGKDNENTVNQDEKILSSDIDIHQPALSKAKRLKLKTATIEPQQNITTAYSRESIDSNNISVTGTLKGESFDGGGYGQIELVTIRGKVKDQYQHPVQGANIQIKGTSHATLSNADGSYELNYPINDTSQTIVTSFIGYKPAEMIHNSEDSLNFTLNEEFYSLSEVQSITPEELTIQEDYISAEPEMGMDAYLDEILKNMRYPASGSGKKETVVANIIISDKGDVQDIIIKRSPNDDFSIETIRLIKKGPLWKPALRYGMPVQDEVKIKLQFLAPSQNN
nr:carboxypeptidase-like regulatory domain-containing protein [uncultured Carboxylicivirga sp.]